MARLDPDLEVGWLATEGADRLEFAVSCEEAASAVRPPAKEAAKARTMTAATVQSFLATRLKVESIRYMQATFIKDNGVYTKFLKNINHLQHF